MLTFGYKVSLGKKALLVSSTVVTSHKSCLTPLYILGIAIVRPLLISGNIHECLLSELSGL